MVVHIKKKLTGRGANGRVLAKRNKQIAQAYADSIAPYFLEAMLQSPNKSDRTYKALAAKLNELGVLSAKGKPWKPEMVSRLQKKLGPTFMRLFYEEHKKLLAERNAELGTKQRPDLWRREWWAM